MRAEPMITKAATAMFWIVILSLIFFGLWMPEQARQASLSGEIDELRNSNAELKLKIQALGSNDVTIDFPADLIWEAPAKPDAELGLQDRVLRSAENSGLSLSAFGTTPMSRDTHHETVAVDLEGTGTLDDFYTFVSQLEHLSPRVAVSALRVRPVAMLEKQTDRSAVYFRMTVWAYWKEIS